MTHLITYLVHAFTLAGQVFSEYIRSRYRTNEDIQVILKTLVSKSSLLFDLNCIRFNVEKRFLNQNVKSIALQNNISTISWGCAHCLDKWYGYFHLFVVLCKKLLSIFATLGWTIPLRCLENIFISYLIESMFFMINYREFLLLSSVFWFVQYGLQICCFGLISLFSLVSFQAAAGQLFQWTSFKIPLYPINSREFSS